MKAHIKHLPAFLILILAGLGCATMETVESDQVPQDEITQTYSVSADKNGMRVYAVFNHGGWGKSVDLDAPSRIEHNGTEMPQISPNMIKGTTYQINLDDFQAAHKFVYTNGDNKVFRNEMSFEPIEIAAAEIVVRRSAETVVTLSRRVGGDENVKVMLNSLEARPAANASGDQTPNPPAYEIELSGELDASRSAIVLKPKNLKKFAAGRAVLKIEVGRSYALKQATGAGGAMSWQYVSQAGADVVN